jgi:EAL domain-containing protein (putative c-di-GMP-specific phosphodiesterase class I)
MPEGKFCNKKPIETEEELSMLKDIKDVQVQGYMFSRPLSEKKLIDFAREFDELEK